MVFFNTIEIIAYTTYIIYNIAMLLISLMFIRKYVQFKYRSLLFVGLTFFILSFVGTPFAINFITLLVIDAPIIPADVIVITQSTFLLGIFFWMIAFTELSYKDHQKLILMITSIFLFIYGVIYYLLYFLGGTDAIISSYGMGLWTSWTLISLILIILFSLIIAVTGLIFSIKAIKSEKEDIQTKGKFLTVGLIFLITAGIIENLIAEASLIWIPIRIIQIIGVILMYIGFVLPKWVKKKL
jgi:hypothetical protein